MLHRVHFFSETAKLSMSATGHVFTNPKISMLHQHWQSRINIVRAVSHSNHAYVMFQTCNHIITCTYCRHNGYLPGGLVVVDAILHVARGRTLEVVIARGAG